ncbi:hypothetical protein KGF54_005250 [Candida jiufengensis]|uniref:uncharacterized protein n=1 Tax=Candida jiufengensis TaxID=497108 RepID=UPI0022243E80|nr:uncharacterized protein KGF54_005250 [Candida jiufengensis]KAI5950102.1 hypothetical protein KGF54_005250 [Candida jiufengensis]
MSNENINSIDSKELEENQIKSDVQTPLRKINSNTFFYLPTVTKTDQANNDQTINSNIKKNEENEQSLSSEEFYEASPTLEEELYFPTLLDEINYPFVKVPMQPHMSKPLNVTSELNLKTIPIANIPKSFPLNQEAKSPEEDALCKILDHEFNELDQQQGDEEEKPKTHWWSKKDLWSKFIERNENDQDLKLSNLIDANIDDIFVQIYK